MTRGPILSEKVEQARILELLRAIGAAVYVSGTVRRSGDYPGSMQTPGIPDLCVFLPGPPGSPPPAYTLLFIECKRAGGRLRPAQTIFRDYCEAAGVAHLTGGLDAVLAWLTRGGWVRQ